MVKYGRAVVVLCTVSSPAVGGIVVDQREVKMKRAGLEFACWPAFSFCWQSLQDNLNMSCTQDWVHQNDVRKRYYCYNSPQLLRESARIHPSISLIFAGKIPEDSPKSGPGYPLGASRSPEARIMDQMGHHVGMNI